MQISSANLLLASQRPVQPQQPFTPAAFEPNATAAAPQKSAASPSPALDSGAPRPSANGRPGSQVNILI
jgi:hypothetical protein